VSADIAARLEALNERIRVAADRSGRDPNTVAIMAVTKTRERHIVDQALPAGVVLLGENRVQEARGKYSDPPLPESAALHLIGQLQTNKVRQAMRLFDVVETVDRPSLIDALAREADKTERVMPVMLQVNVAGEQQKSGCDVDVVPELISAITDSGSLSLTGLMTIAPLVDQQEDVRVVFRTLRELRRNVEDRYPSLYLSMGMSNDLDVAVEEGATIVRVGRALFG
jgi:pyridoxal phosphate enzyme (YggS family)